MTCTVLTRVSLGTWQLNYCQGQLRDVLHSLVNRLEAPFGHPRQVFGVHAVVVVIDSVSDFVGDRPHIQGRTREVDARDQLRLPLADGDRPNTWNATDCLLHLRFGAPEHAGEVISAIK